MLQRLDESRWAACRNHHATGVQPVDQCHGEGGEVNATKEEGCGHLLPRSAFRAMRSRPNANTTAANRKAPKTGGPNFLSALPPASWIRSMRSDDGGGLGEAATR